MTLNERPLTYENSQHHILLTGATGYIGGRLLRKLESQGYKLRCLARNPAYLEPKVGSSTEIVRGDLLDKSSLDGAFEGIDTAFYLIHSMGMASGFEEYDRMAASNFAKFARQSNVKRIIYLGGLGESREELSAHLNSRQEVGEMLRKSGVPTLELRASIVIGSGSLSFELVRSLTEKLPVMILPKWVNVLAQPIGIEDLILYLVESIHIDLKSSRIVEIGGADQLSYYDLMVEYAKQRKLKRFLFQVPVLTPRLSSLWLGLVTPVYARVGRKLIDSIRHPTIVKDPTADSIFSVRPNGASESIRLALQNEEKEFAETRWSDALSASGLHPSSFGGLRVGSRLVDSRQLWLEVSPEAAFEPIAEIGGKNGWYAYNFLWKLRGLIDLLIGGVGVRRGRSERRRLRVGDALDFWRVEAYEEPRYLRLFAEMKLPGRAWLEFEVVPENSGVTIRQTAVFHPSGLLGLLYWYGMYPVHALVFRSMIRSIGQIALMNED